MNKTTMMNSMRAQSQRRLRTWAPGLLIAALVAIAAPSQAQPAPGAPMAQHMDRGMGRDMDHGGPRMQRGMDHHDGHGMAHGMAHGMMFGGSPMRMGRMIDRMLDGLNATDAQRSQIKQIAAAAAADLKAQREAGRSLRERGLQLFTAPTVDANAVEALRQQMLAQHDRASRRTMQAMLDISRVLTPQQRAKIGERINDRAARRHDWMERMHDRMERMHREQPAK